MKLDPLYFPLHPQYWSLVSALQTWAGKLKRALEALDFDFPVSLWFEYTYTPRTLIPLDHTLLEQ